MSDSSANSLRDILEKIMDFDEDLKDSDDRPSKEKKDSRMRKGLESIIKHCTNILNNDDIISEIEGLIFFVDHARHQHSFISCGDNRKLLAYSQYIHSRHSDSIKNTLGTEHRKSVPSATSENNECDRCGEVHE